MMIGLIGGGTAHIRLADGSHRIIDGMSVVPLAGRPDMYRPIAGALPRPTSTENRAKSTSRPKSVAAPGSLRAWCEALSRLGTMSLADVMQPAIRLATRGFTVTLSARLHQHGRGRPGVDKLITRPLHAQNVH